MRISSFKKNVPIRLICLILGLIPSVTLAMPPCPDLNSKVSLENYRDALISSHLPTDNVVSINSCIKDSPIPQCLKRLKDWNLSRIPPEEPKNLKELLAFPAEILDSDGGIRADADAIAKAKGWPAVKYKMVDPGAGFGRSEYCMIEVPGKSFNPPLSYDRFINISLKSIDRDPDPNTNAPIDVAAGAGHSIVTVEHSKTSSKIFMGTHMQGSKTAAGDPFFCVACHPSGLRQISPLGYNTPSQGKFMSPENWKIVQKINADMDITQDDGPIDVAPSPPYEGASWGQSHPKKARTEQMIVECAKKSTSKNFRYGVQSAEFSSNPPIRWKKVAEAMDCESCHDGSMRGRLGEYANRTMINFKILGDKSMPHGMHEVSKGVEKDELNVNERIALAGCLEAEFTELQHSDGIYSWLSGVSCEPVTNEKAFNKILNHLVPAACP
jgi:hypothetical protein